MCSFVGMICALCSFVLLFKYVARKSKNQEWNRKLKKHHAALGIVFSVTLLIHSVMSIPLFYRNNPIMIYAGFGTIISCIIIMISGFFIGKKQKAMTWHRIGSVLYIGCLVGHLLLK